MKKLSKFKKMKREAASYLVEELKIYNFNRFTTDELKNINNSLSNIDKPFIFDLLLSKLDKCLPIKLNFANFIVDIKIIRTAELILNDDQTSYKKIITNEVVTKVSLSSKRIETITYHILGPTEVTSSEKKLKTRHHLIELLDMRALLIVELSYITEIHNALCKIFKDMENIYPSIISSPGFCLTGNEIEKIER